MTTLLPSSINTVYDAKVFLSDLHKNNESYHPEDDANTIIWKTGCAAPTPKECNQLNKLMDNIYMLPEFDPCEYILNLG